MGLLTKRNVQLETRDDSPSKARPELHQGIAWIYTSDPTNKLPPPEHAYYRSRDRTERKTAPPPIPLCY
ncbi:hypothetical protein FOVG_01960 [Fusarium oxysporum f. sp. pisi HDV247]|uniref:Uncharacterized protein n=1 Tax=Fusarium oxysporum f. sp. pisi HDV247 TaxID=1080344 RepID=W9QAF2_FUSOX|nr:hypothetical protein FOVG_01960 [Fusarium oxysporum f. sp. pisi HDV247]